VAPTLLSFTERLATRTVALRTIPGSFSLPAGPGGAAWVPNLGRDAGPWPQAAL